MSSPVSLQNGVRLRIILVFGISILIALIVPSASDAVNKSISIMGANSLFYFTVLICSIIPSKVAWIVACIALFVASILDIVVFFLGFIVTSRCLDEGGCIQTLPFSLVALVLVGLVTVLDLYQTWNVYLILQTDTYVASATQRLRVVLTWALPFTVLVNIALIANSEFSIFATVPMISLPMLIVLAHENESTFLVLLMVITLLSIAATLFSANSSLAVSALMIEGVLTSFGLLLLFMPAEYYVKPSAKVEADIHILPAFTIVKPPGKAKAKINPVKAKTTPVSTDSSVINITNDQSRPPLRKRTNQQNKQLQF